MSKRTTAADALHQSGQRMEAGTLFAEAEAMQQKDQPQFDLLYSLQGFHYCDWLLAPAEQAAWQHVLHQPARIRILNSQMALPTSNAGRRRHWRGLHRRTGSSTSPSIT